MKNLNKLIEESLINKDNIKKVRRTNRLNPNRITKKDLKGTIKDLPLGIAIIAVERTIEYRDGDMSVVDALETLEKVGIMGSFSWSGTPEGMKCWSDVDEGNYEKFYSIHPEYKNVR